MERNTSSVVTLCSKNFQKVKYNAASPWGNGGARAGQHCPIDRIPHHAGGHRGDAHGEQIKL